MVVPMRAAIIYKEGDHLIFGRGDRIFRGWLQRSSFFSMGQKGDRISFIESGFFYDVRGGDMIFSRWKREDQFFFTVDGEQKI